MSAAKEKRTTRWKRKAVTRTHRHRAQFVKGIPSVQHPTNLVRTRPGAALPVQEPRQRTQQAHRSTESLTSNTRHRGRLPNHRHGLGPRGAGHHRHAIPPSHQRPAQARSQKSRRRESLRLLDGDESRSVVGPERAGECERVDTRDRSGAQRHRARRRRRAANDNKLAECEGRDVERRRRSAALNRRQEALRLGDTERVVQQRQRARRR